MKKSELKQIIREIINEAQGSKIITIQRSSPDIDTEKEFRMYKYAIPECEPIKLSNGMYLHVYKVTQYNDQNPAGDEDEEQDAFEREQL
jgi:hypothetical protein